MNEQHVAQRDPAARSESRKASPGPEALDGKAVAYRTACRAALGAALLAAALAAVAPGVHADSSSTHISNTGISNTGISNTGASKELSGGSDPAFSAAAFSAPVPAGGHALSALDDAALDSIRGRYVDARALNDGADSGGGFVILWDEHPARGGGDSGTGKSLSSGHNNQQDTRVTTWRGQ